jgi:hypothetical protein
MWTKAYPRQEYPVFIKRRQAEQKLQNDIFFDALPRGSTGFRPVIANRKAFIFLQFSWARCPCYNQKKPFWTLSQHSLLFNPPNISAADGAVRGVIGF